MWPFIRSPEHRLHHRLLDRLREAYVIGEDLAAHRLLSDNLRLLGRAGQDAKDDPVLYQHWFGQPVPAALARAQELELKAWHDVLSRVTSLSDQGYYPEAFKVEIEKLRSVLVALQDLIHLELTLITHPPNSSDDPQVERFAQRLIVSHD